jgi:hypothetical protein
MPGQISAATEAPLGAVAAACNWYVIHKKAPGAMSAMAFMLAPIKPRVGFTLGTLRSAMIVSSRFKMNKPNFRLDKCFFPHCVLPFSKLTIHTLWRKIALLSISNQ